MINQLTDSNCSEFIIGADGFARRVNVTNFGGPPMIRSRR